LPSALLSLAGGAGGPIIALAHLFSPDTEEWFHRQRSLLSATSGSPAWFHAPEQQRRKSPVFRLRGCAGTNQYDAALKQRLNYERCGMKTSTSNFGRHRSDRIEAAAGLGDADIGAVAADAFEAAWKALSSAWKASDTSRACDLRIRLARLIVDCIEEGVRDPVRLRDLALARLRHLGAGGAASARRYL
jgi:hypothetical protein